MAEALTWAGVRSKQTVATSFIERSSKSCSTDPLTCSLPRRAQTLQGNRSHRGTRACAHHQAPAPQRLSWGHLAHDVGTHLGLAWHQAALVGGYIASNDPDFETKATDVIGLYLTRRRMRPYSVWMRRSQSKSWDRKHAVLPLSRGRAERNRFEYFRHGTLSLCAVFNTYTGEVILPLHFRTRPIRNVSPVDRAEHGVTAQPVAA